MRKKVSIAIVMLSVAAALLVWALSPRLKHTQTPALTKGVTATVVAPVFKYGMDISSFIVKNHEVQPNEIFADVFTEYNIAYGIINFLAKQSKSIVDLRKIKAGSNFTVLCTQGDSGLVAQKVIYEENKVDYVVFNLADSVYVYRGKNKCVRKRMEAGGIISSSLYNTFEDNGIDPSLAMRMADIFAWSIDFYKLQKGDKFKIIYDEDFVDGQSAGFGDLHAVVFNCDGKNNYAFYYKKDGTGNGDYYDENGNSMKKMFLKSPVKFSFISSRYSMNRYHPVTKQWKAHLGTDYAAAPGTPILATADGVVEEACFKQYNGNYVKIRHNGQYKTQYLHMSKIGKGIKRGVKVKQGEVIGYVGSTGLATGPHVCYRFWKDGAQVDPLKQKLTFSDPLPAKYRNDYMAKMAGVKAVLDNIDYNTRPVPPAKETIAPATGQIAAIQ